MFLTRPELLIGAVTDRVFGPFIASHILHRVGLAPLPNPSLALYIGKCAPKFVRHLALFWCKTHEGRRLGHVKGVKGHQTEQKSKVKNIKVTIKFLTYPEWL